MDKKTAVNLILFYVAWMALMGVSAMIGGGIGLTIYISGTIVLFVLAWHEYDKEKRRKKEKERFEKMMTKLNRMLKLYDQMRSLYISLKEEYLQYSKEVDKKEESAWTMTK